MATILYDAGARILDAPPAPKAPEVVVSEEALRIFKYSLASRRDTCAEIFRIMLAANPWAIDAAIRQRVEALPIDRGFIAVEGRGWASATAVHSEKKSLLAALGVAP